MGLCSGFFAIFSKKILRFFGPKKRAIFKKVLDFSPGTQTPHRDLSRQNRSISSFFAKCGAILPKKYPHFAPFLRVFALLGDHSGQKTPKNGVLLPSLFVQSKTRICCFCRKSDVFAKMLIFAKIAFQVKKPPTSIFLHVNKFRGFFYEGIFVQKMPSL